MNSIEWLIEMWDKNQRLLSPKQIIEQAKLLHKEEILAAWKDGKGTLFSFSENKTSEQYYLETFVSKGSDDHISDISKMVEDDDILIPMGPNVQCRDGKEIGVWMKGWEEGYKEAKSILYTDEQMIDLLKFVIESKSGLTSEEFRKASYSFMVKKFIQSLKQPKK
jgi:hypothetical protein